MEPRLEKSWHGLRLQSCNTVGEFRQVLALEKEVWGFDDLELVPARFFVVGERVGGHILGAWDGASLVAFVFGIPAVRPGVSYIHSHMLAVKEGYRNTGLGREMKLFQREVAMAGGFDLVEWTFDPLEIKNAYFNLEKLGVVARQYLVNLYGIVSSPLQGGLPTDRLVAEWWLRSPRVEETLRQGSAPRPEIVERVEIPGEVYLWKSQPETRAQAAEILRRSREQLQRCLKRGLAVVGFERNTADDGCYLLGAWDEPDAGREL
jgi:predicted GNAT superfamily acetyltransferase